MKRRAPQGSPSAPVEQGDLFGGAGTAPPAASASPESETEVARVPLTPASGPRAPSPLKPFSLKDAIARDATATEVRAPEDGAAQSTATSRSAGDAPAAPRAPTREVLSVSDLTRQIKHTLESRFARVIVRGEVSGYRGPNVRGHLYFQLKDAEACVDAKIWASAAARQRFQLKEGMEVIAEGSVDLYAPQGRYSLIIHKLEPVGEGALALAFQQLKERLAAEGLIGERRRAPRPIPFLPRRIGVVTSRTGAALQDFLRVLHRRHPGLSVLIADARVQGSGAAAEVVRALQRLARTDVDVIVVTRGGGSLEDLWTFNEEIVARAIHACPVPVISAIGHEVDFTIADFVADLRAPTPSAAAERVAPVLAELEARLATNAIRLRKAVERHVLGCRRELASLEARLDDPRRQLGRQHVHLTALTERMTRALRRQGRGRVETLERLLSRVSRQRPQALLAKRREGLRRTGERLERSMLEALRRRRGELARKHVTLERVSPRRDVSEEAQRLAALKLRMEGKLLARRDAEAERLVRLAQTLDALSPLRVMSRGYAVSFRESDGRLVRGAADVSEGDALVLRYATRDSTTLAECDEVRATVTSARRGAAKPAAD